MRKIFVGMILAGLIMGPIMAEAKDDNPMTKLGRGVANILTSPVAVFKCVQDTCEENGIVAGMSAGACLGFFNMIKRIVVGAYEVITFPIPVPKFYAPILTDPEYYLFTE